MIRWRIGLDVGSTTVKAVVVDCETDEMLWKDYQRHETKQAAMVLDFLTRIEAEVVTKVMLCPIFIVRGPE